MPGPLTTLYQRPLERVMFHPERDCNPFFHFFESLWMLAGRNDLAFPEHFVKRMRTFSDDGETLHGAYGHRWRVHFGFDQLPPIALALKENPDDRRNVLQMWDAEVDLARVGKDVPCNTQCYFTRDADGALDMTVCNRSNDVVWGAYGANAVHFSYLQEYVAYLIGCPVGRYWQISNNFHGYLDTINPLSMLRDQVADGSRKESCPYSMSWVKPFPLANPDTPPEIWQQDLNLFLEEGPIIGFREPFFRKVATPLWMAHEAFKRNSGEERYTTTLEILQQCRATDWRRACEEWVQRRYDKWKLR